MSFSKAIKTASLANATRIRRYINIIIYSDELRVKLRYYITVRNDIQLVRDHYGMLNEFYADMSNWIGEGKIKWRETVFEGTEYAPKAFLSLFNGKNIGKMLLKVGL
ncbi:MAG: hypothetical protein WBL44_16305 [Nitrososphaeraceae archaeon]